MWLRNRDHSVLVSPMGGSILQWQYQEHTILGPARVVRVADRLKERGETHWCFPNFGSVPDDVEHKYPKHGIIRRSIMDLVKCPGDSARFEMSSASSGINTKLVVGVSISECGIAGELGVISWLSANNYGREKTPILPAIHPYFAVPEKGLHVTIGNWRIKAFKISSKSLTIERCNQSVIVSLYGIGDVTLNLPGNCSHVVLWSDNPSSYICVEPIFGKPGTFGTNEGNWLAPNEEVYCAVKFGFKPVI